MVPRVSVIIPTYKRASTLHYVLDGLKCQTYRNFELVVVFKPCGDNTLSVLEQYRKDLSMKIVIQEDGFVTDAYNLGLEEAKGQIVAFLDDDAVPYPNWLEEHVRTYNEYSEVGGVSGTTKSVNITKGGKIIQISEDSIYPYGRRQRYYNFPWRRPINGMSGWLIFFGRDGLVHHQSRLENKNFHGICPSLLHMGANMSVKKEAVEGLSVNENLILGFAFEQLFSYEIWRRDYKLFYNPNAKVSHIVHCESMGRFFQSPMRAALRDAEFVLTFFVLRSKERRVSWFAYFLGVTTLIIGRILRGQNYGFLTSVHRIYGLLYGSVVGCSFVISGALGGNFSMRNALTSMRARIGQSRYWWFRK